MLGFHDYPTSLILAVAFAVFLAIRAVATVTYNLFFHPLAKIPGPRFAAATYLYQTYFSLVGGSRFYIQIAKLHEIYGPMVRITPDEVHLSDANNYELYQFVGSKHNKPVFYDAVGGGLGYSTFGARSAEVHRIRRSAMSPFFSRKMVLHLEHIVQEKVEKLSALLAQAFAAGESLNLHFGYRALSVDVASKYAFAQSYDLLDRPDLGESFIEILQGLGPAMWIFQQWPGLQKFALALPPSVTSAMSDPMAHVLKLVEHCRKQCADVKALMDAGQVDETEPSIFQSLLSPKEKDPDYIVPTPDDLKDEAFSILAAAADTTGNAMTVSTYRVLSNPAIYARVKQELEAAFPDANARLDFVKLEQLPYLSAIIKEGLRLSFGVPGRLPREVPDGGQVFNGVHIPAGYSVSMSSWVLHHDPEYFPDATTFNPDRWLDIKEARRLEKAFVPFGKGTRGCVGMPLAYCEMYVTLGTLFRRFGNMKSNDLKPSDIVIDDYFSAYHPFGTTKFQVTSSSTSA